MMNAQVSVVMPCRNAGGTIDEAVESILGGTFADLELIAVDDGSTDDTPDRLAVWERRDHRLRVVHRPRGDLIAALNAGLDASGTPLVARMDADDVSLPNRLAAQVAFMDARPEVAVLGSLVQGFPEGDVREGFRIYIDWLNGLVSHDDIARQIFIESPLVHPSVMLRREWVEKVGAYQERGWPEDYDLWLRLLEAGAVFSKVPQVLLLWREHEGRATRTDPRYAVENFLRAKAHYLVRGPLAESDGVIIWGAGQMGKRLSKHLLREGARLVAFVDIDPSKIGRSRRGRPIIAVIDLDTWWARYQRPVVLAAVGSRGARSIIRGQLIERGLVEGRDWWAVA